MKKIISLIVITISLTAYSQNADFKTFFVTNKFKLIDIKYNAHSHMEDIDKGYFYFPENKYRAKMEMKSIVYDSSKAEHKKLLKNLKFKQKDTVFVYDWDPESSPTPEAVSACKIKYNKTDSSLTFYDVQDIETHASKKTSNPFMPIRKFKLIKTEKDKFILLDKDFTDVKRTYIFKKIIK